MCRLVQLSRVEAERRAHIAPERHNSFNRRRPKTVDFRSNPIRRSRSSGLLNRGLELRLRRLAKSKLLTCSACLYRPSCRTAPPNPTAAGRRRRSLWVTPPTHTMVSSGNPAAGARRARASARTSSLSTPDEGVHPIRPGPVGTPTEGRRPRPGTSAPCPSEPQGQVVRQLRPAVPQGPLGEAASADPAGHRAGGQPPTSPACTRGPAAQRPLDHGSDHRDRDDGVAGRFSDGGVHQVHIQGTVRIGHTAEGASTLRLVQSSADIAAGLPSVSPPSPLRRRTNCDLSDRSRTDRSVR